MAIRYTTAAKNAKLGATGLRAFIGNGALLRVYAGTKPTTADTAVGAQTLLATATGGSPFGTEASGVLTANAFTNGTGTAGATSGGTNATWFQLLQSNGTTVVLDGDVSNTAGSGDLKFDNVNIATGQTVAVSAFTIAEGN